MRQNPIKTIKKAFEYYKLVKDFPAGLELTKQVVDFCCNTSNAGRPMVQKIALVNTKDGTKFSDFVTLWAGIGEVNLIDRLSAVVAQRNSMKELLTRVKDAGYSFTEADKKHVELALKYFE